MEFNKELEIEQQNELSEKRDSLVNSFSLAL